MMRMNIFVKVLSIVLICVTNAAHVSADLSDGLVAYYSFDDGEGETLADRSGFGTDGELINFDFEPESGWADGQIGGALDFDGFDDFVIVEEYELAETALSVSIWAFADTAPVWASLVKNWAGPPGQFHFGLGPGASQTLNIFLTNDDAMSYDAGADLDEFPLEEWVHAAFVVDPDNLSAGDEGTVTQYLNGEIVSEEPILGAALTQSPIHEALGIGVKPNGTGDGADPGVPAFWDGRLDDLGIWTRAVSEEEMSDIYARGMMGDPLLGSGIPGDFNRDGELTAADMDLLSAEVRLGNNSPAFDVTGDGVVNQMDRFHWIETLKNSFVGDSNLDGEFNSTDLVTVFTEGEYEDGVVGNSTWADGDWNGDTEFDSSDFVEAFSAGGYEVGPRQPVPVPEPTAAVMALLGVGFLAARRRR